MSRSPDLSAFLNASAAALREVATGPALDLAERLIPLWETRVGSTGKDEVTRLPVCDWIPQALAGAYPERADLARSFGALRNRLTWKRRGGADPANVSFWNGHANAVILGPGGLEERKDLWIGATVMAPGTLYPDHHHAPEEAYLSLTPGDWWNSQMDWTDPGPTGFIYNPPGITHAMRAGAGPFLALWYLPL